MEVAISPLVELVIAMLGLLLVSAVVLAICKRYQVPFTVALVLVGMGFSHLGTLVPPALAHYFQYTISPDLILYVCLPTLIFESAYHIDFKQLQRNLLPTLTLAIPGLLISTALIGLIVFLLTPLNFLTALLLGAILSATDPVAVTSLFKKLGAPQRLTLLVEGESLFNDATSIVTAKLLFAILIAGTFTYHQAWHSGFDFLLEFFGGVGVGLAFAVVIGHILGKVESDPHIEISLTVILAYASFVIAQKVFHVSGIMATVAAGLMLSRWGEAKISPSVSHYLKSFWDFMAYIVNALIFLLVGLSVHVGSLADVAIPLTVVVIAMLLSRAVVIYGLIPLVGKLPGSEPINLRYQTVMYWGGLRGAIALAIILSLGHFEHQNLMIILVTGAVLFTLLVQGLSMEKLVSLLGLNKPTLTDRFAEAEGQLSAMQMATDRIPDLQEGGFFSARIAQELKQKCASERRNYSSHINELTRKELDEKEEERMLFVQCLAAEKALYYDMYTKGHLSERAYRTLVDSVSSLMDKLRYGGTINLQSKLVDSTTLGGRAINIFKKWPFLRHIAARINAARVTKDYENYWGMYQGSNAALQHLDDVEKTQIAHESLIKIVSTFYQNLQKTLQKRIDSIAEQFPEFVTAMQQRLAERLILHTRRDSIRKQAQAGTIPASVAETSIKEIENRIFKLKERPGKKIEIDPNELLRKVPFFKNIPVEDFKQVTILLRSHIIPTGEVIIKQGATDDSLYLITRGVVRVSRKEEEGEEKDLASLVAGDFFGEAALLHREPRNATCRSVTPCALYELKRQDFDKVKAAYPAIQTAIELADVERQEDS